MADDRLAERFEEHRAHLRAVAHRVLGSAGDADDAVQEAWLRLSRSGGDDVDDLRAWLTTVTARVCLNALRARAARPEDAVGAHVPDPVVGPEGASGPEQEALLADSIGVALLVVLETLTPAERIAFVLHDLFAVPFDDVAPVVERSPAAARQLASRARRRVRGTAAGPGGGPDTDVRRQREVVDAFFAAARGGDLERLVEVLDPDVVLRSDGGALRPEASIVLRGARAVAQRASGFARTAPAVVPALVNGAAGAVVVAGGRAVSVMGFTVRGRRVVALDVLADPARLGGVDVASLHRPPLA